jgi:hypothetical protein
MPRVQNKERILKAERSTKLITSYYQNNSIPLNRNPKGQERMDSSISTPEIIQLPIKTTIPSKVIL